MQKEFLVKEKVNFSCWLGNYSSWGSSPKFQHLWALWWWVQGGGLMMSQRDGSYTEFQPKLTLSWEPFLEKTPSMTHRVPPGPTPNYHNHTKFPSLIHQLLALRQSILDSCMGLGKTNLSIIITTGVVKLAVCTNGSRQSKRIKGHNYVPKLFIYKTRQHTEFTSWS